MLSLAQTGHCWLAKGQSSGAPLGLEAPGSQKASLEYPLSIPSALLPVFSHLLVTLFQSSWAPARLRGQWWQEAPAYVVFVGQEGESLSPSIKSQGSPQLAVWVMCPIEWSVLIGWPGSWPTPVCVLQVGYHD